ncbi:glycosyltransferase family 2 protein [Winogradskyella sp. PG-2]|uniref:glycosyltransferase family 2 protein n=1 Tax=Winogradskyella sp. PG-2 TaxID=754409 RepID=UPI00045884CD|nr:glycosyltransferase family A protein [Winogradskyella sp. PG-2]BAO74404.1 glycosyl transferase [Winogradskyella sp. PG-2]
MQTDLVSIIIPTYNRAKLLPETLDSILEQSYNNWECIIVDDRSTDKTKEVVNHYTKLDSRFLFYERPIERLNGANACRNYGFEKSNGQYINWFDSDDIMLPNFLKSKLEIFNNENSLEAVFAFGAYFDTSIYDIEVSKPDISYTDILDYVTNRFYLITHGPLWKKTFLKDKELYDEHRQKIQDTEFHFRMLIEGVKFKFYDASHLFLIRRGDDRISSRKSLTVSKLEDVLKYHYFTLISSKKAKSKQQQKYLEVTSRNILKSFYELVAYQDSLLLRYRLFKKHRKKIEEASSSLKDNFISSIKIKLGVIFTVIFKKGFSLLVK